MNMNKENLKKIVMPLLCILFVALCSAGLLFGVAKLDITQALGKIAVAYLVIAAFTFGVLWIGYKKYKLELHLLYFIALLGLGSILTVAEPVFSAPDEMVHFFRAYDVSNFLLGETSDTVVSTHRISEWNLSYYETEISKENIQKYGDAFSAKEDHSLLTWYENRRTTSPRILYAIGGIGITLGRLFHWNLAPMAAFGQLLNLIFFGVVTAYGIYKIPYAKRTMAVIGLLPMVVQQATSFSYDMEINGAAFLLACLSLSFLEERPKKKDVVFYILALWILYCAKAHIYAILVLVTIVLFAKRTWLEKSKLKVLIPIGGILILGGAYACMEFADNLQTVPVIARLQEEGYSPYYYLIHPGYTIPLFFRTLLHRGTNYIFQMMGGSFGWFQIYVWTPIVVLLFLLVLVSAIRREKEPCFTLKKRILILIPCVAIGLLIFAAMLIYETGQKASVIEGVQGRYFLPVLLPVLVSLGFWKKPILPKEVKEEHFLLVAAGLLYITILDYLYLIP